MACCWKLSIFDFVDCYRRISIPYVTRRFDTTLDKFGNLDTNLSVGLLSKYLLGNFVDNKVFEDKEIVIKMRLIIGDKLFVLS